MQQNRFFPEIRGALGFGCMRLPMKDGAIDREAFSAMADAFIAAGFNYFDTAHGYHGGMSEPAVRECVARRHDRSSFLLTDKLTAPYFNSREDVRPFFFSQLEACGVDYFDFYLMHAQDRHNYEKFKRCGAYEEALKLKEEGLIRHFGLSFHDKPEVLERILTDWPQIEVVQIQFNYADYSDPAVDGRGVYEVCERFGKPVIVMEPVKGGSLARLPEEAAELLAPFGGSHASFALRFAAGFPNISLVLSGMSDEAQMADNVATMSDFKPLGEAELRALDEVCAVFKKLGAVPCTACRYCVTDNECPMGILIPDLLGALNAHRVFHNWNTRYYYVNVLTRGRGKASDCIGCGGCEAVCPQHLQITSLLADVADALETGENVDED